MKKEKFFKLVLCLVATGILVGAGIPTVSSGPSTMYWIETDYDPQEGCDREDRWMVLPDDPYNYEEPIDEGITHNLTWWTDYDTGVNRTIKSAGYHINTKASAWVELNVNKLTLYVKVYGQSNNWPEQFNWTISNGRFGVDPHFTVDLGTEAENWLIDIRVSDGEQIINIGRLDDTLWLELDYYPS